MLDLKPSETSDVSHRKNLQFTILVVDDDPLVCEMLNKLLAADANIIIAPHGYDALDILQSKRIDLVLLDNNMPGMTGLNLLSAMQCDARLANIPVLMLTGAEEPHGAVKAMSRGAMEYIKKPFAPEQLVANVRKRLKKAEKKILIVDDDPVMRQMLISQFSKTGVHIIEASDGPEALLQAHEQRPQLIILDRMLPGMDGLMIMQMLREDRETSHIPVLLLTGKTGTHDIEEGFRLGADDYMTKPFTLDEVIVRATRLMSLPVQKRA